MAGRCILPWWWLFQVMAVVELVVRLSAVRKEAVLGEGDGDGDDNAMGGLWWRWTGGDFAVLGCYSEGEVWS